MASAYCNSCGSPIGHPEEDLHDPENIMQIVEGGVSNEGSHLKAVDTAKGPRLFCRPTGKMTKIVDEEPGNQDDQEEDTPSGGEPEEEPEESPQRRTQEEVYDLQENKSPEQLVAQVVTNEIYGLNDGQINEMQDWVGIYDGRIPPDRFEEILRDFDGVSKQKARLMRTKYEVMLDREMRRQADDRGPSIGATASAGAMPQQRGGPSRTPAPPQPPPSTSDSEEERSMDDLRKERRYRRVERRNDALDTAAEQFADAAARQMAEDFGGLFGDLREVLYTAFKKKAEKDPDWFFEKAEKWDLDILDTLLEPSEARKREMQDQEPDLSEVDSEIDEALRELETEEEPEQEEPVMDETIVEEQEEEDEERIELDDIMGRQ